MLAIGRALMAAPRLLLLDEPSLGLAPIVVDEVFEVIRTINAAGVSVLLVEQNVQRALEGSSRGYLLAEGRIVLEGDAAKWPRTPRFAKPSSASDPLILPRLGGGGGLVAGFSRASERRGRPLLDPPPRVGEVDRWPASAGHRDGGGRRSGARLRACRAREMSHGAIRSPPSTCPSRPGQAALHCVGGDEDLPRPARHWPGQATPTAGGGR